MHAFFLYLLTLLSAIPGSLFQIILVCRTVSMRHPKQYLFLCELGQIIIWTVNIYILPTPSTTLEFSITVLILLFSLYFASKGQRIIAGLSCCVYLAVQYLTSYVIMYMTLTFSALTGISVDAAMTPSTIPYAGMTLVNFFCAGCTMYLSHLALKKFLPRLQINHELLLFLPVPLSQAVLVNLILRIMPDIYDQTSIGSLLAISIPFCVAADFCYFLSMRKARQNTELKAQIRIVEEQFNTQISYYRQLQENILSINQIRHDLTNQLQAAYVLMEQGAQTQVRRQLDILQENVRNQVGPKFCANLMVDAVLSEKAAVCREHQIQLDINAQLPSELPVEGAHLCSAFSNLLDNSIQGALSCQSPQKQIELRTALHADYLIIRCINTADPPIPKKSAKGPLDPHGLGLDILRKIAKEYNGTLDTTYHDGIFETSLILKYAK